MTPEQFSKAAAVFEEARQRSAPDRAVYLQQVCGADARVRTEVESLLMHHDDDSAALSDASGRDMLRGGAARLLQEAAGGEALTSGGAFPQLEHFTIVRLVGAGGMAVVYEAVQDNPRRSVALKMIRPEASSAQLLKRFDREVNVLGGLQHAGIAQIHEAGTINSPLGPQPFFAMEYVEGQPLTRFAEERSLTPRERLDVFLDVCDAVTFAHDRHVIHRDLKPANILVNGAGRTKVLDFGVARVIDPDLRHSTLQTEVGQLVGTIPYMSPEQVRGNHDALDARADIYALGVVLFELLSGRLPYELAGRSIPDAVRVIQDSEPSRLGSLSRLYRVGLTVGILGGFTTFSAFAWETFSMTNEGQGSRAMLNVLLSIALGLVAVWLGHRLAERWYGV